MPCLSINYNPAVGPLLNLAIADPSVNPAAQGQNPAQALQLSHYMALIDTGASNTCISAKVISDLKLQPSGKMQVSGVHGAQATNLYQFKVIILFPTAQMPTGLVQASAATFDINGSQFIAPTTFDVLLGRDVICKGNFTMAFDGHVSFSI